MNTAIPISLVKKKEYEDYVNREKLPLLRLDSTYLLNLKVYSYIVQQAENNKIDVFSIEGIGKLRKGQEKIGGVKALGIMVKSIAKLTIHPLKLEVKSVSQSSLVNPCNIAIISTGIGSIGRSGIVPRFFHKLIEDFFDEKLPVSVTQHVVRFELEREDVSPYYIIALLNSFYGRMLIEGIATYGATGQLEVHIPILSKLKVPIVDIQNKVAETIMEALEEYESKAWRAYFKAMKIVEEYLGKVNLTIAGTAKLETVKMVNRIDSSVLLAYSVLAEIAKLLKAFTKTLGELFTIIPGNVPWSSEYIGKTGVPYIGINAIDDSGIVDEEKLDYMSPSLLKPSFRRAKSGEVLLVKDGSKAGKAGMVNEPLFVRQGICILKPRYSENDSYYILSILKSKLYQQVFRLLTYGSAQPHLSSKTIEELPIILLESRNEIAINMKEFVENMYRANARKKQAIMELENYILKLLS